MTKTKGDAVEKLAHRLAYTIGTRCAVRHPERAADIVGDELNNFLFECQCAEAVPGTPGQDLIEDAWIKLVQTCIERVDALDAQPEARMN